MPHSSRSIRLVALSAMLGLDAVGVAEPILAQRAPAKLRTITVSDTAHGQKTLFTKQDALVAAGFVGLTIAMFPLDRRIATKLQNPATQARSTIDRAATSVEYLGSPGAYFIAAGLYAVGTVGKFRDVQDLGWHGAEALLVSSAITSTAKRLAGRSRPFASFEADTNPRDFKFTGGFDGSDRQSFPSGHTTMAFAAASVVTSELRRHHPKSVWYVAPAMYGGATLVGLSRMYHNKHWASDVVIGAAIGTFSGLKVVRYSHAHPHNFVDRYLLPNSVLPDGKGGVAVAWSVPTR
jgi:membrane-associated phospholipid phosphatase